MALILQIDTSAETASISIANAGTVLAHKANKAQKEHASFLHIAIDKLLKQLNLKLSILDAIAVVEGPGSYTGLRVGMSSAKGLCFALKKPMVTIGALNAMAQAFISSEHYNGHPCTPLIDARRMEVFTATFDKNVVDILTASAMILEANSFSKLLNSSPVNFFGNGADKFKAISTSENALFFETPDITGAIASLAFKKFHEADFADLRNAGPLYVKEFYNG